MPPAGHQALDTGFYRVHHGLGRVWRGGMARVHYRALGRRRAWQPHPLFDPHFFVDEAARRGIAGIDPRHAFDAYMSTPHLWSIDPHAYVSFAHEPFASSEPGTNPLMASEETPAREVAPGTGHPLLDAAWWLSQGNEERVGENPSLGAVLRAVAVQTHAARLAGRRAALGPRADVLFINGENTCPACTQYRVWNPALALRRAGLRTAIINAHDLWRWEGVDLTARAVVVFRAISDERLMALLQRYEQQGTRLVFDCDDLVFGPEQVYGTMVDRYGARDREVPNAHIRRANQVFQYMRYGTFPTQALASTAIDFGLEPSRTVVAPSFLSEAQASAASMMHPDDRSSTAPPRFAVAAGTWTHHDDLATVADVVARAIADSRSELHALGSLPPEDFPELAALGPRVVHDPRVIQDWGSYIKRYAGFNACLVPLDMNNGFCHAKSEVKYIEAGIVGTPIIASPTEAHRRAIASESSGWLADDATSWTESILEAALPARASAAGAYARDDVLRRYGPGGAFENQYVEQMRGILANRPSSAAPRNRLTVGARQANVLPSRLADLLRSTGCTGVLVRREPRLADAWITSEGDVQRLTSSSAVVIEHECDVARLDRLRASKSPPPVIVQGPGLRSAVPDWWAGETLVGLPWADAATFSPRSALSPRTAPKTVALISPPESVLCAGTPRRARKWAEHAWGSGLDVVVVGAPAAALGLPIARAWTPGCGELELATLFRECVFAVRLDPIHWGTELTGALLAGTPLQTDPEPLV